MATPNLQSLTMKVVVIRCARCGHTYTEAEWKTLRHLGNDEVGTGHIMERRTCSCGVTLAVGLVPVLAEMAPTPEAVEVRLRARLAALEADLATSARYRQKLESENAKLRHQLWLERAKARPANQAPNPPGVVSVVTQDPADPSFTTLRKVGG